MVVPALMGQALKAEEPIEHVSEDMIAIFNNLFQHSYNTVLVRGDDEPIYLPADDQQPQHRVIFAHGFFASSLHEISHWCIAGEQRRLLEDFGYWYEPDGRSAQQQSDFEQVEVKPQALEWILAKSCGYRFRVSTDNLNGETTDSGIFKAKVYEQAKTYLEHGLTERPTMLVESLAAFYGLPIPRFQDFSLAELS